MKRHDFDKLLVEVKARLTPEECSKVSDDMCRRYLRAKNGDVSKAVEMAKFWVDWFPKVLKGCPYSPANILDVPDPHEHVYQDLLPHSNLGEDKHGRPIYWEKTGLISSRMSKIKKFLTEDDLFNRHVRQQELMLRRLEIASHRHGRPIEKQVIVFDLKGLSYSLDQTALNAFYRTLAVDQSVYAERLETMFMINSPWFFKAIWSVISPFVDPVTASKIRFLGSDYLHKLRETIDDHQIPAEWGGANLDFHWEFPRNCTDPVFVNKSIAASLRVVEEESTITSSLRRGEEFLDERLATEVTTSVTVDEAKAGSRRITREVSMQSQTISTTNSTEIISSSDAKPGNTQDNPTQFDFLSVMLYEVEMFQS